MFYVSESFYNYLMDLSSNNLPNILIGLGLSYVGFVGTFLLCTEQNKPEQIEIDETKIQKELKWIKVLLTAIRSEHNSIVETILENKEEIENFKRHFEFRTDMRVAEIDELRNRIIQIENNIYETSEEE